MSKERISEELKNLTLEDVERQFEITRARIRQIEEGVRPGKLPEEDDSRSGAPAAPAQK
jgi:hypothetical protein